MGYGPERERWFAFRSERLRIFMEAWLNAHALNPVKRPVWVPDLVDEAEEEPGAEAAPQESRETRRARSADALRRQLRDIIEALGPRELDNLASFGEFLRSRHASRPSSGDIEELTEDVKDPAPPTEKAKSAEEPAEGPRSDKVPAKLASST